MVAGVKALGLETCATLGMLTGGHGRSGSRTPGLDYYNHNLDTSPGVLRRHHHHADLRKIASTLSTTSAAPA